MSIVSICFTALSYCCLALSYCCLALSYCCLAFSISFDSPFIILLIYVATVLLKLCFFNNSFIEIDFVSWNCMKESLNKINFFLQLTYHVKYFINSSSKILRIVSGLISSLHEGQTRPPLLNQSIIHLL